MGFRMLMFDGIYCEVNLLRGQLKHSWLENQVRDIDTDDIVSFWKDGEWLDTVGKIFPHRLQQTLELADRLVDGFSPAQLVGQLAPLGNLSDELRKKIKLTVHASYLAASHIASLEEPIRQCAQDLQPELNNLWELWKKPFSIECEFALRACWDNIRAKGKALHEQLEKLPRGVVFP